MWMKFVITKDWEPTSLIFICLKHFKEKCYNDKRYRLTKILKPVPTIFNPNIQTSPSIEPRNIPSQWQGQGNPLENVFIKLTNTKFSSITIELINLVILKEVFLLLGFYSRKMMTMSSSTKLNLVKKGTWTLRMY